MSVHAFPRYPREAMLYADVPTLIRPPVSIVQSATEIVLTFTPDLTAAESSLLDTFVRYGRSETALAFVDWQGIVDDLDAMRTFRQQSQSEFMALTATQRDRALFDVVNAQTNVLRALLRD